MKTKLIQLFLVTFLIGFGVAESHAAPIGINVGAPRELIYSEALIDLFKTAEGWFTSCKYNWTSNRPIDPGCTRNTAFNTREANKLILDQKGWVKSFGQGRVFTSIKKLIHFPDHFKPGRFVLDYVGAGNINISGSHGHVRVVSHSPNYIVVDILAGVKRNIQFEVLRTNPRNHMREIRFYRQAHSSIVGNSHFRKAYIDKMKAFDIIRFMPWASLRTNLTSTWASSNTADVASYIGPKGIPEELMIDLANKVKADPWFSLPYAANDDYVKNFALYVKNNLHPGATVYLEYSNEVWNEIFQGTGWARKQALKSFPGWQSNFTSRGITEQAANELYLGINYYSKRTVEMCNIWKSVFAGQSGRVKCILSSYVGVPVFSEETLACPLMAAQTGQDCGSQVDYFGVAPYFGHYMATLNYRSEFTSWANNPSWGLDMLFEELFNGGVLKLKDVDRNFLSADGEITTDSNQFVNAAPRGGMMQKTINEIASSAVVAKKYGIPMISYEGGQSIIRYDGKNRLQDQRDHKILEFIAKANKDPRIEEAYNRYLDAWGQITGGQPILHFSSIVNSGPHAFFGMFESMNDSSSPKWRAFQRYSRQRF